MVNSKLHMICGNSVPLSDNAKPIKKYMLKKHNDGVFYHYDLFTSKEVPYYLKNNGNDLDIFNEQETFITKIKNVNFDENVENSELMFDIEEAISDNV